MARIISSRKKYVPVKDLVVYPSKTETIEVIPDDGFNGAHRYRARMCAGFVNGKWEESDDDGIFWSEEDFNDSLNKLFGTVAFPELNKGECMEIELVCELKMK
jgi:hypothetical protein